MTHRFRHIVLIVIWLLSLAGTAYAVNKAKSVGISLEHTIPDADALLSKRSVIENMKELDESDRNKALALIDRALALVEEIEALKQETEETGEEISHAPARMQAITKKLKTLKTASKIAEKRLAQLSAGRVEEKLGLMQVEKAQIRNVLDHFSSRLEDEEKKTANLPSAITQLKERLNILGKEKEDTQGSGKSTVIMDVRNILYTVEKARLETEIRMIEQHLAGQQTLLRLLAAERDLAAFESNQLQSTIQNYQAHLQSLRQKDAEKERKIAEEAGEKSSLLPPVRKQIDLNIELTSKLEELTRGEAVAAGQLEKISVELKEIDQEFALAKERVDNMVLTGAVGLALREQKQMLPSVSQYRNNSYQRQRLMAQIQESQIDLDRKLKETADPDESANRILAAVPDLSFEEKQKLIPQIRELATNYKNLLEKVKSGYQRYFKSLRNLEYAEQQLIARSEEFSAFLSKNLMWIRSSEPIGISDVKGLVMELKWILSLQNLNNFLDDVKFSLQTRPVTWLFGVVMMSVLLMGRKKTGVYWEKIANKVKYASTDSILMTFQGFLLLVYESLVWSYFMGFMSLQLTDLPQSAEFTQSVATGLASTARVTFLLTFCYGFCRSKGLAQIHFKWSESARLSIRRNLGLFTPLLIILSFIISTMGGSKVFQYDNSLAKLGLMAQGVTVALFCAMIFRFSGGLVSGLIEDRPHSWVTRFRYAWYPLTIMIPLSNMLLVGFGYFYSALELRDLTAKTIFLGVGIVILRDLALRFLARVRNKFITTEALRTMSATGETPGKSDSTGQGPIIPAESEISLAEINIQTRVLLETAVFIVALVGVWAIWKETFGAFTMLQEVRLWAYNEMVDGVPQTVPITLANLIMAVLVVVTTYIAAHNLPGLLEITLVNRISLDTGARYAFTTLCRYGIIAMGGLAAINTLGFNWVKLQWLIAALGVGLGFGLQEIVANFISGLIVLFERPFRIGDTITIGDTVGTVSRIKIRATTITDWDRKELIVPNKEFITGRLVNWTLSDPIIRIVVPVGIAYGSDTALAEKLLIKAAEENSMVLKKPAPMAVFKGFGDNSLNFELRVFINGIQDWIPMLHSLNMAIDQAFRKAELTISFPQRDVHLDTIRPLEFRVVSSDAMGETLSPQ